MAFISMIGKVVSTSMSRKAPKLVSYCDDPLRKEASDFLSTAQKWADNLERDDVKQMIGQYDQQVVSNGEIKKLLKDFKGVLSKEELEIFSDEKIIQAATKRKELLEIGLLKGITPQNKKMYLKVLNDKSLSNEQLSNIMGLLSEENLPILKKLLKDKNFNSKILKDIPITHFSKNNIDLIKKIAQRGDISRQEMLYLLIFTRENNADIAIKLLDKAGKNTDGLNTILQVFRKSTTDKMSEEAIKKLKIQKKLLNELLDNPQFKLGETELDNFRLAKVLEKVTPENSEIIKQALLKGSIKPEDLTNLIEHVTPENKKVIEEIAAIATKDTTIPAGIGEINPEALAKYIDEVSKIENPQIRNQYLAAMGDLRMDKLDEILNLIRTSKPQDAQHSANIIRVLNKRGIDNINEANSFVKMFEQSGRNISNFDLGNISVLCNGEGTKQFLEQLLKTKSISNYDIEFFMEDYLRIAQNFKSQGTKEVNQLHEIFAKLSKNKNLSEHELEDIFSSITTENIDLIEQYVLKPEIKMMNTRLMSNPENKKLIEIMAKANIPKYYQGEMLSRLKGVSEEVASKRIEIAQQLFNKDKSISSGTYTKILDAIDSTNLKYVDDVIKRKDLTNEQIVSLLEQLQSDKADQMIKIICDTSLKDKQVYEILTQDMAFELYKKEPELVKKAVNLGVPLDYYDTGFKPKCIADAVGVKNFEKILREIEQFHLKHNLGPASRSNNSNIYWCVEKNTADDMFVTLSENNSKNSIRYKFDKKTSELVSIEHNGKVFNLKNNTTVKDKVDYDKVEIKDPNSGNAVDSIEIPYLIETTRQGKNGQKVGMLYSESPIKGQYEIFATKPDGSRVRLGSAQVTPNGAKHIRRTIPAADGSKSTLSYREDKAGNSYLHSVIKDKTRKQISEVKRTFKVLSDNHFISTHNGQAYDIVFTNDKVTVTMLDNAGNKTKKTVEFAIKDIPLDTADELLADIAPLGENEIGKVAALFKQRGIEPHVIDRSCVDMLKRLPGDEWFAMSKSAKFIMPQSRIPYNACYAGDSIFISKEHQNNLGVFAHELGHGKFHTLDLVNDKKLLEIYNKEKEAYTAAFPKSRVNSIDYFLAQNDDNLRGLNEACAETNLVTDTIQTWEVIQDRTIFYEQYFPQTIAYLREKFKALI